MLDPDAGLLFPADLVFVGRVPSLDGSLPGWLAELDALEALGARSAVPGHGPALVDLATAIAPLRRYLDDARATTSAAAIAEGRPITEATATAAAVRARQLGAVRRLQWTKRDAGLQGTGMGIGATCHEAGLPDPRGLPRRRGGAGAGRRATPIPTGSNAGRTSRRLIFGDDARIATTDSLVTIDAPERALRTRRLVPVAIATAADPGVTGLSLIVDENPGPMAAQVRFGPAGDPRELGLRVRVDGYTNVHAVATLADGSMVANAAFVKGAGGCSAPVGVSDVEAMAGMGEMRMKFADGGPDGTGKATLMVRHPNFNGMQMNQVTRLYTPARYVTDIEVTRGGELVFAMQSDISLATDPVIDFLYRSGSRRPLHRLGHRQQGAALVAGLPGAGAEVTN